MIEIIIMGALLALVLHSTVKQKVYSFQTITLSTLAAATAMIGSTKIDATRLQGAKISDIFGRFSWAGKTVGEGPVYYGFSQGLSLTEIQNVFAADPQSQDDPNGDQAMQRLIVVGEMSLNDAAGLDVDDHWHKIMWPSSWEVIEGSTFDVFVFNRDGSALTTGAVLKFNGMLNTEWRQD